jgi:hypothetical protein
LCRENNMVSGYECECSPAIVAQARSGGRNL